MSDQHHPTAACEEATFRALAEAAPQPLWAADRDGRLTYVNPAWVSFTGRPAGELLGDGWVAAVHPDDLERVRAALRRAVAESRTVDVIHRLRRFDGAFRWIHCHGAPVLDGDGAPQGYVGAFSEVHVPLHGAARAALVREAGRALETGAPLADRLRAVAALAAEHLAERCTIRVVGGLLPPVEVCSDPDAAPDAVPPPDSEAALVLPLRARGARVGTLELVNERSGEPLDELSRTLATDLAGRVALAVDAERLVGAARAGERAANEQRELYETLLRAQADLGEAFLLLDGEQVRFANEAAARMAARPADELRALRSVFELVPARERPEARRRFDAAMAGEPQPYFRSAVRQPAGARLELELAVQPIASAAGTRLVLLARDVTDRVRADDDRERLLVAERRARRELEVAHRRASFLAQAGALLESTMEVAESLAGVCALVVSDRVADVVCVDALRPDRRLHRVAGCARGAAATQALTPAGRPVAHVEDEHPVARAVREARRVVVGPLDEAARRAMAEDEEHLRRMREIPSDVGIVVPLVVAGRIVGTLSLGWYPGDEPALVGPESRLVDDLAGRIALALEHGRLYEERVQVARTLQDSLLPPLLPEVPGLELAGRYVPGWEGLDVGGDFYDAFPNDDGSWTVVVGDVCGKGAEAAGLTAMTRWTLRAQAERDAAPDALLAALNATLLRERDDLRFVTAVVARLRVHRAGAHAAVGVAGHPAPLVLRAGGPGQALDAAAGPLLGILPAPRFVTAEVDLGPGDALVLHTDGLTEARRQGPLLTGAELGATGVEALAGGAAAVADALLERAARESAGVPDDRALVVVRAVP
jgi:PAS domain S-box-containing protein